MTNSKLSSVCTTTQHMMLLLSIFPRRKVSEKVRKSASETREITFLHPQSVGFPDSFNLLLPFDVTGTPYYIFFSKYLFLFSIHFHVIFAI